MVRNLFIDKLKGFAIILVVWGHCIQFCVKYDVLNTKLFELIYAFHMPFFMAVSGYLYYQSVNRRNFKDLIISRIKQLLIPFLIWSFFYLLVYRWQFSHTLMQWIKNYIYNLPFFFWFIWSLLISSLCVVAVNKFFKDKLVAYFILFILILLLPNGLGFYYTKYMVPYFFAGYLVHKYHFKTNKVVFLLSFIVFTVMWYFWKNDYYIYSTTMVSKLSDFKGMYDDSYRYIAGFLGILVFITLIKKLPDFKVFEVLGRNTLGIYFISSFLNSYLYLLGLHYDQFWYNFIYTPVLTIIIVAFCVGLSMLINKSKILNQYLLGGR